MAAPAPLTIARLDEMKALFIKQTKKGCIQELLGCEAVNEFKIYENKDQAKGGTVEIGYSLEESSFLQRFCCANMRGFEQTVWTGTKDSHDQTIMKMNKGLTCNAAPMTCCCIPKLNFTDEKGGALGSADVPCYFCLPGMSVKDPEGKVEYILQQPSCMGGLCVDVCAEGLCNCKIPVYIYPPGSSGAKGEEIGKIIKMWRGMGTEVFTDAASFQVDFPDGAGKEAKQRLIGATMFINMLFFEKSD